MPAVSSPSHALVAEVLERIARAEDLGEACSVVLDRIASEGVRSGGLVLALRTERGLQLTGWEADERALESVRRDEHALLAAGVEEAIDAGTVIEVSGGVANLIHQERCVLVPFPGPEGGTFGVLLMPVAARSAAAFAGELLRRCGPSLHRCDLAQDAVLRADRLDRQRDLLSTIINAQPDPVLLTDGQNNILLANRRAEALFTTGPDASPGLRRAVQVNNLLFSSFLTRSLIEPQHVEVRELNLVDPGDGSDLLFEVLSVPMPNELAASGSVISILRDITDLKRAVSELENQFSRSRAAEHRARRERDQLDVILENVGDPILVTDEKSSIILMNREAERLFVPPPSTGGESRQRRAVRTNDTKFTTLISNFLLQPEQRRIEKLTLADPDSGDVFPAEAVSSKILNARGEPTAIVSVLHDLTQVVENARLARELQELNDQLEERIRRATQQLAEHNRRLEWQSRELEKASRLKSEFLASMSHELRTPINVVLGYTSLLREQIYGSLTSQQSEALEKIFSTSQHLLDLINDILDLSKIEAGKMPVHPEELHVAELMRDISGSIEPLVQGKGLDYETRIADDVPVLFTDTTKLKQIMLNLLSNAVKFTQEGSVTVCIDPILEGEAIRIQVEDTGIGIRDEDQQTIFEDFRQVDQSRTREHGGTGLGLSITKKLLSLLGGTIGIDSTYGVGSKFTIELPVAIDAGTLDEQVHRAMTGSERTVVPSENERDRGKRDDQPKPR